MAEERMNAPLSTRMVPAAMVAMITENSPRGVKDSPARRDTFFDSP